MNTQSEYELNLDQEKSTIYPKTIQPQNKFTRSCAKNGGEPFMVSRGILDEQIEELLVWSANPSELKFVFFDWDKTLSVVEGIPIYPQPRKYEDRGITCTQVVTYLIGGEERLEKLCRMFHILQQHNVNIFIITNNRTASKDPTFAGRNRPELVSLLNILIENFQDENLICSGDNRKDKVEALRFTKTSKFDFSILCDTLFQRTMVITNKLELKEINSMIKNNSKNKPSSSHSGGSNKKKTKSKKL